MSHWYGFLIGLSSGIIATLIADNAHVRFHLEKAIRKLVRKQTLSLVLTSFTNYCANGGMFMTHCVEIRNNMWLTPVIPNVYLLSRGDFDYDVHAYKPFIYFRSRGIDADKLDLTIDQVLDEYASRIIPYTPDNPNLAIRLRRGFPVRIAVVCEVINSDKIDHKTALNHQRILGAIHAAVANPMPKVAPGSFWTISIISEDLGLIDSLNIAIPKDLEEREPLGDSMEALLMDIRPPCLLDIDSVGLTWPLRFYINDCEIQVKRGDPKKIVITAARTNKNGKIGRLSTLWKRIKTKKIRIGPPGIKIR